MQQARVGRVWGLGMMLAFAGALAPSPVRAQVQPPSIVTVEQPDAQRTKQELSNLLERYPPALRGALALDPSLLSNQSYLAPYPALVSFLSTHPEVARNPSFYIGEGSGPRNPPDYKAEVMSLWRDLLTDLAVFAGFGMAIGVVVWLIRTVIDYRRWSRLAKVQTDAHTKLLDRFTANEDLLAYIQSPAGLQVPGVVANQTRRRSAECRRAARADPLVGAGGLGACGRRHWPGSGERTGRG